ncbi:MAG TPA: hypothetical protein VJ741_19250 [Solirubrobacteraceae bacterium]|nr:hypothetical protein [Solirubrobacteraceae bacterium]
MGFGLVVSIPHDAAPHAVFPGFMMSTVFAHAPVTPVTVPARAHARAMHWVGARG